MVEILTAVVSIVGVALILWGAFQFKPVPSLGNDNQVVEVDIAKGTFTMPTSNKGLVLIVVGFALVWLAFNLFKSAGQLKEASNGFFISSAYAQGRDGGVDWVYFGYAKNTDLWRYDFVKGSLKEMMAGAQVILKAKGNEKVLDGPYKDFHGTALAFLSGPYPNTKSYEVSRGSCVVVAKAVSVGFSKIWVEVKDVPCI